MAALCNILQVFGHWKSFVIHFHRICGLWCATCDSIVLNFNYSVDWSFMALCKLLPSAFPGPSDSSLLRWPSDPISCLSGEQKYFWLLHILPVSDLWHIQLPGTKTYLASIVWAWKQSHSVLTQSSMPGNDIEVWWLVGWLSICVGDSCEFLLVHEPRALSCKINYLPLLFFYVSLNLSAVKNLPVFYWNEIMV